MKKLLWIFMMISLSFVIYACGAGQSVTIKFESNGGDEIEDLEIDLESDEFVLPTPVKSGYTFDGWYLNEDLSDPFSLAAILSGTTITVYAKWTENTSSYTITFETNGGSAISSVSAIAGDAISAPTDPTKADFTFDGWYADLSLTTPYTFTTMPASNLILYAKWTAVILTSTITFNSNGGSAVAAITQNEGSVVAAPANPTKVGFTFEGWYSDELLLTPYVFSNMPANDLTLYAKWVQVIVETTLTFETNGGSPINPITLDEGSAVTAPPNPLKEGYIFDGWFTEQTFTNLYVFTVMPNSDLTLYAKWSINTYTLQFLDDDGAILLSNDFDYLESINVDEPVPVKLGYTFVGWDIEIPLTMPASDVTLTAVYEINSYTLEFIDYDGSIFNSGTFEFESVVILSEPIPVREGYTFIGWDAEVPGVMPAHDVTLNAVYEINSYTITFETNGGEELPDLLVVYGTSYILPIPTKGNDEFAGWFYDAELTDQYVIQPMPAYDFTVYGKWIPGYALTYVVLGDEDIVQHYIEGESIDLIEDPIKAGYDFVGWYIDELLISPLTHDTMPDHDMTVYAKFEPATYTLFYDSQAGSDISPVEVLFMDHLMKPNDPYKEGYIFIGWYYDETVIDPVNFETDTMPSHDLTIYASYLEDEGYMPISVLLEQEPEGVYRIRGTVIYKFPNQMDHPGFYIYDGTGTIFVLSYTNNSIGDVIEFDGTYSKFEYTPQLVDTANFAPNLNMPDFPMPVEMSYEELAATEPNNHMLYGKLITITGIIAQNGPEFMLTGLSMGLDPIAINFKSLFGINPFTDKVGQTVTFQAIIHGYNQMMHQWHIVYDPNVPVVASTKTTQEKLEELALFATDAFAQMVFYPNQNFIFPENEPVYGATLVVTTSGDNALYYDPMTGDFLDTDVERIINVSIVATLEMESIVIDVTFLLKPLVAMSIDEFKALEEGEYGLVEGIVIMIAPFEIALITDGVSTLPIIKNEIMQLGDLVLVQGYKNSMDGITLMENNPEEILVEIISHDHPNPLTPIELMMDDFMHINGMDPTYWLLYYQLTGELTYDANRHEFFLQNGMDGVLIIPTNEESEDLLILHLGEIVSLRGFGIPFDGKEDGPLALIFTGADALIFDFTDEELIDLLQHMLDQYLSSQIFIPGQVIDLPTEHPIYPVTVSYLPFGENAGLLDMLTNTISETIETETWIDLEVTLTLGEQERIFNVSLHIKPFSALSVSDFLLSANYDEQYMVHGIVVFIIPDQNIAFIADEFNIIGAPIGGYVNIGDEVLLLGHRIDDHGFTMIVNDPEMLLFEILSIGNPNPLQVTTMSLETVLGLNPYAPENQLMYIEISGQLVLNPEYGVYFLTDGTYHVPVWPATPVGFEILKDYQGMNVRVRGLTMSNNDDEHPMIMLIFMDDPSQIVLDMTALEFANQYALNLQVKFIDHPLTPDTYFYPPTFFDIFEIEVQYQTTGDNALLYNVETGYIDASITVETYIDMIATILVPGEDPIIVNFQILVVPIPVLSVTEFIELKDYEKPYYVEGIVIYEQSMSTEFVDMMYIIADDQHLLFVNLKSYVEVGSRIRLFGFYQMHEGMPMIQNDPSLLLSEIIDFDNPNPLNHLSVSILNFIDLPEFDPYYQFMPYELTGFLFYDDEGRFTIEDQEGNQVVVFAPSNIEFDKLIIYDGIEVRIKGLCFQSDMHWDNVLLFIGYEGDIEPAYTTEEYVDHLALTLPDAYASKYFIPGQFYHLPEMDPNYPISFTYSVIDPLLYDLMTETFASDILVETDVVIELTITGGTNTQVVMLYLTVIPPVPATINEFINGTDGVLYLLQGVITFDTPDQDDGPQMISDSTGSLFIVNKFVVNMGDEVVLAGYRGEFEGLAVLNLNHDAIFVNHLYSGVAFPMAPIPMTIEDFLWLDITDRSTWGMYVELTGYVGVDYYFDYPDFYLYEGFYSGYQLPIQHTFGEDSHSYRELGEYNGLETIIRGYVLPDFIDDYLSPSPIFMYITYPGSIEFTYDTDLERINALIQVGDYHLQDRTFYAYDDLELPNYNFLLSIGLDWSIVAGDASLYDFTTGRFNDVLTPSSLTFEVTMTAGDEIVTHQFIIYVEPLPTLTIAEYHSTWYEQYSITEGVIIALVDDGNYILADETGMIVMHGFTGLNIGDEIRIYGKHDVLMGQHRIYGHEEFYDIQILNMGAFLPLIPEPMTIYWITAMDPWMEPPMRYVEIVGRLLYGEDEMMFYLNDGAHQIMIKPADQDAFDQLFALKYTDVSIKLFTYYSEMLDFGWGWTLLFVGEPGELTPTELSDQMKAELFYNMIEESIIHMDHYPNTTFMVPGTHPFYGGSVEILPINNEPAFLYVDGNSISILEAPAPCLLEVEIVINMNGFMYNRTTMIRVFPPSGPVPFIPGEFGELIYLTDTSEPGTFPGLIITQISMYPDIWDGGSYHLVEMSFPEAYIVGASYYTLQYYNSVTMAFENFMPDGVPITTDYNNFSLEIFEPTIFRLITTGVMGGELVSNEVLADITAVETTFDSWYMDSSASHTMIMSPFVGHRIEIGATVVDMDWMSIDNPNLLYNWYRVDPYTFEMTEISDETTNQYITTYEDIGYYIVGRISGDESSVGGYLQIFCGEVVKQFNPVYISDVTETSFILNFGYFTDPSEVQALLTIQDEFGNELDFTVIQLDFAVIEIQIDLFEVSSVFLYLNAPTWMLGQLEMEWHMMMTGYYYQFY